MHHKKYSGANPWDAPDEDMETICSTCHIKEHFPETKPVAPVDPEMLLLGEINRAAPHWYKAHPDLSYPPPDLIEMYKERQKFSDPELWKGITEDQEIEQAKRFMELHDKIRFYGKLTN